MIKAFGIQVIISLVGFFVLQPQSTHMAKSFAFGALIVAGNFLILGIAWSLIFKKKLIALAVSLIVFKYAILGLIIYQLINVISVDLFWFSMGVASFILSALAYTVWTNLSRP